MLPFTMKTQRIQAAFARKRDAENLRIERTTATDRYFDHWGKVTSRYQTWTTPEYYENAEETVRKSKEQQIKDKQMNEKREKLQILLNNEKQMYENEMASLIVRKPSAIMKRRSGRLDNVTTNFLEKIHGNLIENNDERRRLELEAKLYSRWRHQPPGDSVDDNSGGCGVSICSDCTNDDSVKGCLNNNNNSRVESRCRRPLDDNALFESKSDHETMAKLNWLDKQIENQMKREQDAKESELRNLQLQEEQRKHEEILKERQKIRESEIKEFRAIQEYHVQELKQRETETNTLQSNEIYLKNTIDVIQSELLKLIDREENIKLQTNNLTHNVTKIKMIFRQRSLLFRQELQNDIDCLNRISIILNYNDYHLNELIDKYKKQLIDENINQSEIQIMYESEAKYNLKKWNELWQQEFYIRKKNLIEFIKKLKSLTEQQLTDNLKQQKQLIEIRDKHLSSIDNSNDKLKLLINDNNNNNKNELICQDVISNSLIELNNNEKLYNSARSIKSNDSFGNGRNSTTYKRSFGLNWIENDEKNNNFIDLTTKKFNNCNLNDENVDIKNNLEQCIPKYGRKKIAWT